MTAGERASRSAALVVVAILVAGCLPTPVTSEGRQIANLYTLFMAAGAVVAFIVVGLGAWSVIRYRGRREELPPQTHGNLRLEVLWTALPAVLVVVLFGATVVVLASTEDVDETTAPGAEIAVTAFRWGWRFEYPGQDVVVEGLGAPGPEVVVPVGEPLRISLTGEDVMHAFYVPEFLFKRDMIPGRVNVIELTVETAGTYRGQCAEYCGLYHARMPFTVRAVARAEYDAWLDERRGQPPTLATPLPSPQTPQPSPFAPEQSDIPAAQPSTTGDPEPAATPGGG